MKRMLLAMTMMLAFGFTVSAHDHKADKNEKTSVSTEKKNRKKKTEVCADCGKPEKECDCHGNEAEKK